MAEFDDKLNSILGNPDAMAQIMQLAQSLGGGQESQQPSPPPPQAPPAAPPAAGGGDLHSSLDRGLHPNIHKQNSNARQLLFALRPYLKEERQEKVERALQLARLFHIGKKVLAEWRG